MPSSSPRPPADGRIRYTFSHELIRQTLNTNLSLPRQQRIHLRVATAIESASPDAPEQQAATLAHHFYQAGSLADPDTTLRHLMTAGRQALAAAAFEDAVAHFTTALSFDRLDEKERADLLYERGVALRSLAQADDAIADWTEALAAYEGLANATGVARASWDLGYKYIWQDRGPEGLAVAKRAEHAVATRPRANGPGRSRCSARSTAGSATMRCSSGGSPRPDGSPSG